MPTYEYRCDACGATYELFQKMSDPPLETCEACGAPVRKVLYPVAIHFKGSGFYTTDYGRSDGRRTSKPEGEAEKGAAEAEKGAGEAEKGAGATTGGKEKVGTAAESAAKSGGTGSAAADAGRKKEKQPAG